MQPLSASAESRKIVLSFALLLRDGFADTDQLLGEVSVSADGVAGQRKGMSGVFLFFGLSAGQHTFAIGSGPGTPYYTPTRILVTQPMQDPLWPAYPDMKLADPGLPLGDPGQKAAYKEQRKAATLLPSTSYPFPGDATLIRGTVTHGGKPLADATVQSAQLQTFSYTTLADGQFVLFLTGLSGAPKPVDLSAKCAGMADGKASVTPLPGSTTVVTIEM
jgi:hypothetical protein